MELKKKQGVRKKCGNGGRQVGYGNDYQGELRGGVAVRGGFGEKPSAMPGAFFWGKALKKRLTRRHGGTERFSLLRVLCASVRDCFWGEAEE
jgi:hypothetical protein